MGKSYFIWNGMDCRNMGVTLAGPVAIVRPEERVKHVEIPGRSGDLTQVEGENVYNSYIQTATIQVRGGYRVRDVYRWLRGAGYVTFSGEPDRRQPARIIGAVTLNKHSHNLDVWIGEVQFYCQPLKELLREETVEITTSGTSIFNAGDVTEKPKIKLTSSGGNATITIGGNTTLMTSLTSGVNYVLDSETQEMITLSGGTSVTNQTIGAFPMIPVGTQTVTGTGWSKLEIDRRERFL
jgi:phage-related protein